jgi:hypothetical protein
MVEINKVIKKGLGRKALTLAVLAAALGFLVGFHKSPYLLKITNPKYEQPEISANDENYALNNLDLPYLPQREPEYLDPPLSKKITIGIAFSALFFVTVIFIACLIAWYELWIDELPPMWF